MSRAAATLVARREIRERGRSNALRIGTIISLLLVAVAVAIPALRKGHRPSYKVGIVGAVSAPLQATISELGPALSVNVRVVAVDTEPAAVQALKDHRIAVAVIDLQRIVVKRQITATDTSTMARFVAGLSRAIGLQAGLEQAGISPDRAVAMAKGALPVTGLEPVPGNSTERTAVFYGILLLLMLINQYGYWLLLGVVEEKATRVVEVLLATISPRELLIGKTVGIGLLALGQGLAIVAVALGVGAATGSDLLKGAAVGGLAVALLWFVLGYIFYCSLYAAGGSLASRVEDAQNIGFPLQLPLLIAYFASFPALLAGTANPVVNVLAYFPPTAPIAMPVLAAVGGVGPVGVAISVVLTLASAVLLMRLAGRIYSRAILRTGRRIKLREVLSG